MSRPKLDNRKDNVDKIQFNINYTIHNIETADEWIAKTDDKKMKKDLEKKNEGRRDALDGMIEEIRDEARAKTE